MNSLNINLPLYTTAKGEDIGPDNILPSQSMYSTLKSYK